MTHQERKEYKAKKALKHKKINDLAAKLRKNKPKSEIWFMNKLKEVCFPNVLPIGKSNQVFNNRYIPDILNHKLKFIVEIDGSVHNLESVKEKDSKKNTYYMRRHYQVIRVRAYDDESFFKATLRLAQRFRNYLYYVRSPDYRLYDYYISTVYDKLCPSLKVSKTADFDDNKPIS